MTELITLNFGKHVGLTLSEVPPDYLRWLAFPTYPEGGRFKVPSEVTAAAQILHEARMIEKEEAKELVQQFNGAIGFDDEIVFIVERLGDIDGLSKHASLDAALAHLSTEFSCNEDGIRDIDTEDDRLLVWEVLPSGHKKVVWQFSGDHWDAYEFGIEQGALPGDGRSLYDAAYVL
jgi:hypothetical protein